MIKFLVAVVLFSAIVYNPASARILPCLNRLGGACGGAPIKTPPIQITDPAPAPVTKPCLNTTCQGPVHPIPEMATTAAANKYVVVLNTKDVNGLRSVPITYMMNTQGVTDGAVNAGN